MESENCKNITDAEFDAEVLKQKGLVLIDFHAPWCGPCRMLGPILGQLATENVGKVKVVKMDIDESPETPTNHGVRAIPCMIMFKDGVEFDRKVGVSSKSQLQEWFDTAVKSQGEKFEPTYPVFENPGVQHGILKKDGLYIMFLRNETEVKQEGVFKSLEEAKAYYANLGAAYAGYALPVYEMREVTEMKLIQIE